MNEKEMTMRECTEDLVNQIKGIFRFRVIPNLDSNKPGILFGFMNIEEAEKIISFRDFNNFTNIYYRFCQEHIQKIGLIDLFNTYLYKPLDHTTIAYMTNEGECLIKKYEQENHISLVEVFINEFINSRRD
jgi:hypothetical protein